MQDDEMLMIEQNDKKIVSKGEINMNISLIGTGYVGLITGICLAEFGMNVMCMDTDREKIHKLNEGTLPIYEPGLEELMKKNYNEGRIKFSTDIKKAVKHGKVIFIAVGTPALEDNNADLQYVFQAVKEIGIYMEEYKVIVDKSTVPVGTGQRVKNEIKDILKQRKKDIPFDVVSNPEFLREGSALKDFMKPDRIVIGAESKKAINIMKSIYRVQSMIDIPLIITNIETAEIIKYASNAFLSTKISFINEIANMCELCNADISIVSRAMGLDTRIGPQFLNPGPGFGGSCFPKDTKAIVSIGKEIGYVPRIVESVITVNENQRDLMVKKIEKIAGNLENKVITILGLAFKPETDDIREAPSIYIIQEILKKHGKVKVFDPQAMENMKKLYPFLDIEYSKDTYKACMNSDCIVLLTEWKEFLDLNFVKLKKLVRRPIFIDLRNVYEPEYIEKAGFLYEGVGR